jgi:hypothetical protein
MTVSFCTTVRNRLHHIHQTLPANLAVIRGKDAELILIDYDSTDGLEEYVNRTFFSDLESAQLRYFKYQPALYFHRSHSKNMALKLSEGDIFCNIDADNFIGKGVEMQRQNNPCYRLLWSP